MKTKGLMFIALLFSGATFAQTATVKHEQQVKVSSSTQVDATGTQAAANTNTSAAAGGESAVTVDPSAVSAAKGEVKSNVESGVKTGVEAASHVEKQTVKAGKATVQQVNNVTATAARSTMHVNGAVNNSLKVNAAPVKVNTLTTGAIGLKGL
jgi:hypothetical protein